MYHCPPPLSCNSLPKIQNKSEMKLEKLFAKRWSVKRCF